ncbi:MAG TPA: VCBS repeat-containing protein, partial [Vicinamibacterales bacterium]
RFTTRSGAWTAALELHVADLDGDGRDDVFGYDRTSGEAMTAMNTANGGFSVATTAWAVGWTVAVGDLNGDGRDDVALYDAATGIWIQCVSTGSGSFTFTSGTALTDAMPVGVPQ